MHQYIVDTSFAARGLINLVSQDAPQLDALKAQQKIVLAKEAYFNMAFMQREMHSAANYWHGRFHEAGQEHLNSDEQVRFLEAQILDKRISLQALAGALLQIAKQGISSVRGHPDSCPAGRKVQGTDLKRVLWAGRNQAQHYEEIRKIDPATAVVFAQLNAFDTTAIPLDPMKKQNLAFEIVTLLGWQDYAQYERDMVSLLG